jgi:hypothetical protein
MSIALTTGIVRILDPNGETTGTGFVVADSGLIATCAHVVVDAGSGLGEAVRLIFHHTGEESTAIVDPDTWHNPTAEDVAILRLDGPLPEGVRPVTLGYSRDVSGHRFRTFGFPNAGGIEGLWGYGALGDLTTVAGQNVIQLTDTSEVTAGFSGAPVWDDELNTVIGMVVGILGGDRYGMVAGPR